MALFGQHTRLRAVPGKADALVTKFLEAAELQRENRACQLMVAGRSTTEEHTVHLVEIWSSEEDWERARNSDEIKAWAADMPGLVDARPESVTFDLAGGKGLAI